ncbi:RNA polymerase II holoenzyme cyclin-like subunit [Knufia obscura]|uniref:RNA polymerase II holoenzyme cyclin-like subunit n=2 Tax=Knufia TaxID=430999 RepID=A0AAN8I7E7_9EURO|nr:RNA polymerase II holoenzyme cyclin-like subunit [Knufia obscura]KAK5955789.1 RNA polymerase II holoenzyme cyclin-like subunit [Knufia fluminis]
MAANYWTSTQKQNWLFEPYEIADLREEIQKQHVKVVEQYPLPDRRLLFIFMKDRIIQLSKRLSFRQQCVATALVYLHRYFLFNAMQNVNIYLLTATAFYLASKTEESPHHIRLVASEARQQWPEYVPSDPSRLGEMEFCLISEMHSQLIVWHPYRSLTALKENSKLALTNEELSLAWSIINDTFMTDLPLTCPPYLIAVTAMFLAVIFVPGKSSLELKPTPQDLHSMMDASRFSSLGGRSGISTTIGQALDGSATALGSNGIVKQNSQPSGGSSIKAKTLAAAASSEKMQNIVQFLVESDIDVARMIDATQEIISLYEIWEQYNEKTVKDAVTRCIRGQHLET